MKVNLFDFDKSGKAKITKHVQDIWYLSAIVEKYGEANALKLFRIFDFVHNLNPDENPFAITNEENKYELVLRSTYPELEVVIDLEDDLIEQALDLVEELYETPKYKAYKLLKITHEKISKVLEYAHISVDKEDGNIDKIKQALIQITDLNKGLSESYKELEEEMEVSQGRGGVTLSRKKQEELD